MTADQIKIGDKVLPPERELRLWMRRHIEEKNLPECALHLTVRKIYQSKDKRGPWIHVKAQYPAEWTATYADPKADSFITFKARPQTPWTIIAKEPTPETDLAWIATTLVNDEASTDDEMRDHFEKEGKMSKEAAAFYVTQRSEALRSPLTFRVRPYCWRRVEAVTRCPNHRDGGATYCPRGGAALQIWQRRQWDR